MGSVNWGSSFLLEQQGSKHPEATGRKIAGKPLRYSLWKMSGLFISYLINWKDYIYIRFHDCDLLELNNLVCVVFLNVELLLKVLIFKHAHEGERKGRGP